MDQKAKILIHLSDIHFHKEIIGKRHDLDLDLRNELERDASQMVTKLGEVDLILVTGDIAYGGKVEEYATATEWLSNLCDKVNCKHLNVKTTPGNHDVERSIVESSPGLKDLHKILRTEGIEGLDSKLREYLSVDKLFSQLFLEPIKYYNDFAAKFNCALTSKSPYWEYDLILNDGSILRLVGLNSTLVSNSLDDADPYKLVLGSFQTILLQKDGVEYLTLCHHPPDWLRDKDIIDEKLIARTKIQLFGHKHNPIIHQIDQSLRIIAGATHPERSSKSWQPTYTFLAVSVSGEGADRELNISIYPRIWKGNQFQGDYDPGGKDYRSYALKIKDYFPTKELLPLTGNSDRIQKESKFEEIPHLNDLEERPVDFARRVTYRFFSLPYHLRMKIAVTLGLLRDEDKGLPDTDLFKQILLRAKENDKLKELSAKIEEAHSDL
jgi:predicted MPP superfamily phosphohydrolase